MAARSDRLATPAVFAFYPNKQITTGEGGVIVTQTRSSPRAMRSMRNQGRSQAGRLA